MANTANTTAKTGVSFTDKVLGFLGMGDEGKVQRFHKRYVKSNEKQISIRKDDIEQLKEKLDDVREQSSDDTVNINLDRIKSTEDVARYIEDYRGIQIANIKEAKSLTKQIKAKEEEIAMFKELNELVQG